MQYNRFLECERKSELKSILYNQYNSQQKNNEQPQNQEPEEPRNKTTIRKCVGVIRAIWRNSYKDILTQVYGTAFLISPRLIITCTHNIYSKSYKSFACQIEFIPDIHEQQVRSKFYKIRRSQFDVKNNKMLFQGLFLGFDSMKNINFNDFPQKEQIALILLTQRSSNQLEDYIMLGQLQELPNKKQSQLATMGYPNWDYRHTCTFQNVYAKRRQLKGHLHSLQSYEVEYKLGQAQKIIEVKQIINHTMRASLGMSGSPILAINQDNQYYAIGIHTHKGQNGSFNSGVYFDSYFLRTIKEIQQKMCLRYRIEPCIKYYLKKQPQEQQKYDEWSSMLQYKWFDDGYEEIQQDCLSNYSEMSHIEEMIQYFTMIIEK